MEKIVFKRNEIVPGQVKKIHLGIQEVIVVCTNKNELYAISNRCPHQGAELEAGYFGLTTRSPKIGEVEMNEEVQVIRCPWHGYEFDVSTGSSLVDPTGTKIRTYQVEIDVDNNVIVKT